MKVWFQWFAADIFMKLLWDVDFYFTTVGNAYVNLSGKINQISSKAEIILFPLKFYSIAQNDNDVAVQAVIWILQCECDIFHTVETSAKINSYEN